VDPVTAHDEEYWMWQVISHGAGEIAIYAWYPMSSGFESNGYGLVNLDGTPTERAQAAGRTAQAIERNAAALNQAQPAPAQVAIFYDRLSYLVGGRQSSLSSLGNAERDSLEGTYRAFFEKQIPVDFVHSPALDQRHLAQYKILFLPYPVMLTERVGAAVRQYTADGGTVVAEGRLAWNDERGFASPVIPGFGLDQVFGAREQQIRPEDETQLLIEDGAGLAGFKAGDAVAAAAFEEDLDPLAGGKVMARFPDGKAAIVEKSYGKGRAIMIGSFAGLAYQRKHDPSTAGLFLSLTEAAGVEPQVQVSGAGTSELEVRRLVAGDQEFAFVFNHGSSAAEASVALRLPWKAKAYDVVSDEAVPVEGDGGKGVLQKKLDPGAIWVVRLQEQ